MAGERSRGGRPTREMVKARKIQEARDEFERALPRLVVRLVSLLDAPSTSPAVCAQLAQTLPRVLDMLPPREALQGGQSQEYWNDVLATAKRLVKDVERNGRVWPVDWSCPNCRVPLQTDGTSLLVRRTRNDIPQADAPVASADTVPGFVPHSEAPAFLPLPGDGGALSTSPAPAEDDTHEGAPAQVERTLLERLRAGERPIEDLKALSREGHVIKLEPSHGDPCFAPAGSKWEKVF